jgi:hypothetical protein
MIANAQPPPLPEPVVRDRAELFERISKLREFLFESEKLTSWISSAVNTPDLPAGSWIYVDALRLEVLAAMRGAHLLELHVKRLAPQTPAAEES